MKRKISVLLVMLCCAYFLCGFGFLRAFRVEKAIDDIGDVTLQSRAEIEKAESLYAQLSEKDRRQVDNLDVLVAARAELDRLEGLVVAAQSAIDALPDSITLESGPAIIAANQAYNVARVAVVHDQIRDYDKMYFAIESYSGLAIEKADTLMRQERYTDAYQLYFTVWDNFPNSEYGGAAYYGCGQTGAYSARALYNSGRMKEAMDTLNTVEETFGTTEESIALREKILKRLEQKRPQSGRTFHNSIGWGYGEFTVEAGSQDACIKLENIRDPAKYALFYVRAGEKATIQVKDGNFVAKYATGTYWFDQNALFGNDTVYTQAEDILEFTTTRSGSNIYYSAIQITLYEVVGGDLETSEIAPGAF